MDRASRAPSWWLVGPDLLVALTVAASVAWTVASLVDGRSAVAVAPAATTAALAVVAFMVRSRSGLPARAPVLPVWFVPAVLLLGAGSAVGWGAADGTTDGVAVGAAALVMAGPAAAVLAVPTAFRVGTVRAGRAGVRIADVSAVEAARSVDTLVLAKDGTVTTGDLTVVSVDPVEPDHDRNLRWFAGALSKASDHRVERAVATLSARGRLTGVEVVDGMGVRGSVDRHPVRVGSPQWIGFEAEPTIWTTVGVEVDGRRLGSITVADDVRPDLVRDLGRLRALDVELVLVSGDTEDRTRHVAALSGIETVHVTDDTGAVVRDLVAAGRTVATIGLPARAGAALAVTAGGAPDAGAGDAPTIDVDDCSPSRVADALTIGRATAARVRRARAVTTALGLAGAVAGATGLAGPVVAAVTAAAICAVAALVATAG